MADFDLNAVSMTRRRVDAIVRTRSPEPVSGGDRRSWAMWATSSCVGAGGTRRHSHWILAGLIAALVAAGAVQSGSVRADAGRTGLAVGLVVLPVAVLQVERQAAELHLTDADIARGYVDVAEGSHFAIRTTSRSGYLLEFHPRVPLFTTVAVTSPTGRAEVGRDGGTLVARGAGGGRVATRLSYRFHLDANVRAGAYPWPLAVSVRPL